MNDFMERLTELVDIPINELRCIFSDVPYLVAEKPSSSSIRQARLESKIDLFGWRITLLFVRMMALVKLSRIVMTITATCVRLRYIFQSKRRS